ncbi:hypothetical protein [Variovorax sp. CY25R-8]|uniref:hypothetical protein n=1 Tax=Variovorax sp. CY25R-8 TaxID=2855501 RepID=UPI0021BA7585|nr:hypothetical protein [Variovorax sp. CY25R-8]MCT8173482.1 hypothetical protein [Variovorax sp. CY25R-8]
MTVVARDRRMAALRELGVSEPMQRLAAGECLHEAFRGCCLGPPFYVDGGAAVPEGPPLVPLWERDSRVAAVWHQHDGLAFIEFSIEDPGAFEVLARSEQGFWASRFDFLYECDLAIETLRAAAECVGFRFLERHLASREAAEDGLTSFAAHRAWLRGLVAQIDGEAAGSGLGA